MGEAEPSREWVRGERGQKSEMRVQEGEYEEVKPWGLQRGIVIWGQETWVSPLPFMSWGALQKGLTLSEPPFCKGCSRVFSNTKVQKHQFFSAQLSL